MTRCGPGMISPVVLALRGSRLITVDGTACRWRMRRNPAYGQQCLGSPLTFTVELAGARGTVLAVTVPDVSHPASLIAASSLIIRPALVAAVIRTALTRGWEPAARRPVPAQPGKRRTSGGGQDGDASR
jgi:hypothetical protein